MFYLRIITDRVRSPNLGAIPNYSVFFHLNVLYLIILLVFTRWWKVVGSIPDDVTQIFHLHDPSGRTVAPGSTQPLTEMSTINISWG